MLTRAACHGVCLINDSKGTDEKVAAVRKFCPITTDFYLGRKWGKCY